jgi:hypothetical protein
MTEMVKFASQVDAEILGKVRALAKAEGRQIQTLIEEALTDFLEKKSRARSRPEVMAAHRATIAEFAEVFRHLAK